VAVMVVAFVDEVTREIAQLRFVTVLCILLSMALPLATAAIGW
jgi:hypothetical protein